MTREANARQLMEIGEDVLGQVAGLRIGHSNFIGIDGEVHHMIRLESEIHGLHGRKAAHEEAGDDQQHQ